MIPSLWRAWDQRPGQGHGTVDRGPDGAGYEVHAEVRTGAYRVALAVVHHDRPGERLLAIESDGAYFPSGTTASDRERRPAQVLASLGKDSLLKEVAYQFGIMRLGKDVAPRLELGLNPLEARGQCRFEGDACHWREA